MLKVGDRVKLKGCPFDEQIAEELLEYIKLKDKIQTVIRVSIAGDLDAPWSDSSFDDGQWIKTNLMHDWTDKDWFKKTAKRKRK